MRFARMFLTATVLASMGCGRMPTATAELAPTPLTGGTSSATSARVVAETADRVLGDAFQAVAAAVADGRTDVQLDVVASCGARGITRISGGWTRSADSQSGRSIPTVDQWSALDVRIAFGDADHPCVEEAASITGTLRMTGQIVFPGGAQPSLVRLDESGELTFALNAVIGMLRRDCGHTIDVETRAVVCAGDVLLQYPTGTPILPAPAC